MKVDVQKKNEMQKKVVEKMVLIYCKGVHKTRGGVLCEDCTALASYAKSRNDNCPFIETKNFCSSCKVHCYSPEMKEKIKTVMRYAGPRMIFHNPIMALRHVGEVIEEKRLARKMSKQESSN